MKKIILFAATILTLCAVVISQAQAPQGGGNTLFTGYKFATGTTNLATPVVIYCGNQQNMGFTATISCGAATTNVYSFGFSQTGLAASWSTNPPDTITWSTDIGTGNNINRTTNINTTGHQFLVLYAVATTLLNTNSLTQSVKISSP